MSILIDEKPAYCPGNYGPGRGISYGADDRSARRWLANDAGKGGQTAQGVSGIQHGP